MNDLRLETSAPPASSGRRICLADKFRALTGRDIPVFNQYAHADCVGQAIALAAGVLSGLANGHYVEVASEPVYAGAKHRYRSSEYPCTEQGARLSWGIAYMTDAGLFVRKRYGDFDLTAYAPALARAWACSGVPREVTEDAGRLATFTTRTITTYEEAYAAIANDRPVVIGSPTIFQSSLRGEGLGTPMPAGRQGHCYCALGVDDRAGKRRICCFDSRGRYFYRESDTGRPRPSFWVDADVFHEMVRGGEAYAIGYHPIFS
ncbi:hypothetical protein [Lewinella sp. IMCC34191]|uniref:hypothetical protein n=1 Tax=Lewinella sp. IMCC34191 TaxID=2259172 RepID=UPI000E249243|nr:hypothetical protein [Lewinella sp. IMCC34191]